MSRPDYGIRDERREVSHECHLCHEFKLCRNVKAAHVPMYAWVCAGCFDKWASE